MQKPNLPNRNKYTKIIQTTNKQQPQEQEMSERLLEV